MCIRDRVKALTNIDPDRLPEEKEREMTVDLGFAWMTLPSGREVSIVDVPGHERIIKNMLAGVGAIDGHRADVERIGWRDVSARVLTAQCETASGCRCGDARQKVWVRGDHGHGCVGELPHRS